jgi:hypothetical protein
MMNYYIKRDTTEYGPYSLADLQKYVQSGQISTSDLCRSDGLAEWVAVSQVVGNVAVPVAAPAGVPYGANPAASMVPSPPNMQWVVLLLIGIFTCGLFGSIWLLVLSFFVKKVDQESKAPLWMMIYLAVTWAVPITLIVAGVDGTPAGQGASSLSTLGGFVFYLVGIFSMKASLENHYLNQFGYARGLSGVMVFFFAPYYFQYHINETEKLKQQNQAAIGRAV